MSENLVETIPYRRHEIKMFYDTDPQSPNDWGDKDQFLIYAHRDFTIKRKGFDCDEIWEHIQNTKNGTYKGFFVFCTHAYIHGGVSLSLGRETFPFNDRWDVSMKGFILIKREKGTWTRPRALPRAESLIKAWNQYLSGEVYGFDCEYDSCWGYYGNDGKECMIEKAKCAIDQHIIEERAKMLQSHLANLKIWLKNRVPLYVRKPLNLPDYV